MPRRVAITGAAGQLGRQLIRVFAAAGDELLPLARPEFDITRREDLPRLTAWRPDLVVNSAAWTDVDGCARDPQRAMLINGDAAGAVAEAAARAGALIVQISTNEVFDGTLDRPYMEDDEPNPINPYGSSKLLGERLAAEANPRHIIVRTAWLFGPDGNNFVTKILSVASGAAASGEVLRVVDDEWGNPTWTPSLAVSIAAVSRRKDVSRGIVHLAGWPSVSRFEWAHRCIAARAIAVVIEPVSQSTFVRESNPPARAVLSVALAAEAGVGPGDWREPLAQYVLTV